MNYIKQRKKKLLLKSIFIPKCIYLRLNKVKSFNFKENKKTYVDVVVVVIAAFFPSI